MDASNYRNELYVSLVSASFALLCIPYVSISILRHEAFGFIGVVILFALLYKIRKISIRLKCNEDMMCAILSYILFAYPFYVCILFYDK